MMLYNINKFCRVDIAHVGHSGKNPLKVIATGFDPTAYLYAFLPHLIISINGSGGKDLCYLC